MSSRQWSILPLSLVLISIKKMSEKYCLELVFISCFYSLKSKVNQDGVQKKIWSRLFFFALRRANFGVEPHLPFIALVVLLTFFLYLHISSLSLSSTSLQLSSITRAIQNNFSLLHNPLVHFGFFLFCWSSTSLSEQFSVASHTC